MILFKRTLYFTIGFLVVLCLDIYFKTSDNPLPYRYITKLALNILLLFYYYFNVSSTIPKKKNNLTYLALFVFLIIDVLFLHDDVKLYYFSAITFMVVSKIIYAARFSNYSDISIYKLAPYFLFCFAYMIGLMLFVYENLGDLFIPSLFFLFASLIFILFGLLRQGVVDKLSFYLVLIGVFFSVLCESYGFINDFYKPLPFEGAVVMLFYGLSQYFIIVGLAKEKIISSDYSI